MTTQITTDIEAQKKQFFDEGYVILDRVIPEEHLAMLREACSYFISEKDKGMAQRGVEREGLTHKGSRYFIANQYRKHARLHEFIFGEVMAELTRALLGPEVYLFNEQWVVKGAEVGMSFSWHQDSGYVHHDDPNAGHKPYLTCWCALDDVDERNGTVYILPHSKAGTHNTIIPHKHDPDTNDLIGYTGGEPGIPMIVRAGSIVAFSSYAFHRSGANNTDKMRRIYLAQYSAEEIRRKAGNLWAQAVPFLKDGENVYDHEYDITHAEEYANPKVISPLTE
ncbi:MAG: phytanoyl-CoA dioxygenase family protein [Phycisphaerales bacterium]